LPTMPASGPDSLATVYRAQRDVNGAERLFRDAIAASRLGSGSEDGQALLGPSTPLPRPLRPCIYALTCQAKHAWRSDHSGNGRLWLSGPRPHGIAAQAFTTQQHRNPAIATRRGKTSCRDGAAVRSLDARRALERATALSTWSTNVVLRHHPLIFILAKRVSHI